MTIRFAGTLLCAAMLLLPTVALAGGPVGTIVLVVRKNAGPIVASGQTDKNGTFMAERVKVGDYSLRIGAIPAFGNQKTAGITISVGGQQDVVKTEKGIMITNEGSRVIFITIPLPSKAFTVSFPVGGSLGTLPRTFTVTVKTVTAPSVL